MAIGYMVSAFIEILFTGSSCVTSILDYKAHVTPILMGMITLWTLVRYVFSEPGLGTYGSDDMGVVVGFIVFLIVGALFLVYPLLIAIIILCKSQRQN
jgi:hypothetical protein